MKHLALSILLLAAIVAAGCIDPDAAFGPKKPVDLSAANITKTSCDAEHACPEGLVCFNFPAKSVPLCATPGPCAYYPCPEGTRCTVADSGNPLQVNCV